MWLIDTGSEELHPEEFFEDNRPQYAILSHRWGAGEVTFADMKEPAKARAKAGWVKISKTCEVARLSGLRYAWVDSCCIDRSSSAELSEAINSMWHWYREATECYAFLGDLDLRSTTSSIEDQLRASEWFRRGWTLQELIAPKAKSLFFHDKEWNVLANKVTLSKLIAEITSIPQEVLLDASLVRHCSVAQRMSWASRRKTTRIEDAAYCLLGIFDINMPLLYGERQKAFRRLQQEIIGKNSDTTLLAWEPTDEATGDDEYCDIFAPSPAAFANSHHTKIAKEFRPPQWYNTSSGLIFHAETFRLPVGNVIKTVFIPGVTNPKYGGKLRGSLSVYDVNTTLLCFELEMVGSATYCRRNHPQLLKLSSRVFRDIEHVTQPPFGIRTLSFPHLAESYMYSSKLHLRTPPEMKMVRAFPEKSWNYEGKFFFSVDVFQVLGALFRFPEGDDLIFLASSVWDSQYNAKFKMQLINRRLLPAVADAVLQWTQTEEVDVSEMESTHPETAKLSHSTSVKIRGRKHVVSANYDQSNDTRDGRGSWHQHIDISIRPQGITGG
ncbi:hypothetical protein JX265_004824 [Neoarthrinium moseri]|uniref:Heterokaryon incompatibility domain-containing protein n=1 Tax=Neoarthrinium moseri TaxID=1658444 RepID=A0A9Q0AS28_9PEZI|nr:hypothetical protein JX266_007075 [Neoarthrinium moseri]KAI1874616.1 hypothetical protein JX265_004824 [Neoarthrinium moseri]